MDTVSLSQVEFENRQTVLRAFNAAQEVLTGSAGNVLLLVYPKSAEEDPHILAMYEPPKDDRSVSQESLENLHQPNTTGILALIPLVWLSTPIRDIPDPTVDLKLAYNPNGPSKLEILQGISSGKHWSDVLDSIVKQIRPPIGADWIFKTVIPLLLMGQEVEPDIFAVQVADPSRLKSDETLRIELRGLALTAANNTLEESLQRNYNLQELYI